MITVGSLFTGAGGLDMAVNTVYGARTVWHSETDPAATRVLTHRYPDVPNLGDITEVDWAAVEPVDILCGGFPCTDVSAAGKRAGLRPGTRSGLWNHMAYAVNRLRPQLVVIENVRGLLSAEAHSDMEPCPWCVGDGPGEPALRAFGAVLGDLAGIGYDARWCGLRASDVGAPHGRFRVFVVAWPSAGHAGHRAGGPEQRVEPHVATGRAGESGEGAAADADGARREEHASRVPTGQTLADAVRGEASAADAVCGGRDGRAPVEVGGPVRGTAAARDRPHPAPDPACDGRDERRPEPARLVGGPDAPLSSARTAADTGGERLGEHPGGSSPQETGPDPGDESPGDRGSRAAVDWGPYLPAIKRWEHVLGRLVPPPTELAPKGGQRLSPRFVEFMIGLPDGWVTGVPGVTRNDQLKILGNGVVPQQAKTALRVLTAAVGS